jgi:HAD superfamily hydrolase (TIGR01450 family)
MDKHILKNMKLFLFDMDGTLYLGSRLYDFTIELLQTIRENGGKYLFITNNSSKSVADYVKKLEKMGISATREEFMTSSQATAFYLHKHHEGQKLYVCGTESLKEELRM